MTVAILVIWENIKLVEIRLIRVLFLVDSFIPIRNYLNCAQIFLQISCISSAGSVSF